jgi:hypothetical protein
MWRRIRSEKGEDKKRITTRVLSRALDGEDSKTGLLALSSTPMMGRARPRNFGPYMNPDGEEIKTLMIMKIKTALHIPPFPIIFV